MSGLKNSESEVFYVLIKNLPPFCQNKMVGILLFMEQGNRPIPNRLKMHRKIMRYKQHQVAHLLGLQSTTMLSLWEQGTILPNSYNLIKLSLIYRTYPNKLYGDLFHELRQELKEKEFELFQKK